VSRIATFALAFTAAGCTTWDESVANSLRPWIGRPVTAFAEHLSIVPGNVYSKPDGSRVYIFPQFNCGYTVTGRPEGGEYITRNIISTCPPIAR
jgi:hypothetical protein